MLNNLIQLFLPVFHRSNSTAWLIEGLKPKRSLLSKDTTKITCIPTSFSFLKIGCAPDHQKSFGYRVVGKILITKKGDQLFQIIDRIAAQHFFRNRNIFACCFRGTGAECIIFYFTGPCYIRHSFQCFLPPFGIDLIVIMNRN